MTHKQQSPTVTSKHDSRLLYSFPAFLGLFSGLITCWRYGFDLVNILVTVFFTVFGIVIGHILFIKHVNNITKIDKNWQDDENSKLSDVNAYATELERLFIEVTPILIRQVVTSRQHTEQEITTLTNRFGNFYLFL